MTRTCGTENARGKRQTTGCLQGRRVCRRWEWRGRENTAVAKETGDATVAVRKERGTRAIGKASGEAVGTGAKEAAKKNKITHLLHMRDREHTWKVTNDRVLTGTSGLSKTGAAVLRKHSHCERSGGRYQGGKGDAHRWKGKRRGSQSNTL